MIALIGTVEVFWFFFGGVLSAVITYLIMRVYFAVVSADLSNLLRRIEELEKIIIADKAEMGVLVRHIGRLQTDKDELKKQVMALTDGGVILDKEAQLDIKELTDQNDEYAKRVSSMESQLERQGYMLRELQKKSRGD